MKRWLLGIVLVMFVFAMAGCYSCQTWNNMWGKGPVEPSAAHKFFFDKDCKPVAPKAPAPKPAPKPAPAPAPKPVLNKCGSSTVSLVYPAQSAGVVKISKKMPAQVTLNAPFSYNISVTNVSNNLVADVVVTEVVDSKFKLKSATPSAKVSGNELSWALGELEAGQTKTIKVTGMATGTECVKTCATVAYVMPACASVQVVQPELKLVKMAPAEVVLCEPIPVKMTVTNTGTGLAKNVKVTDNLPTGLTTSDGKRSVTLNAGTLAAGQSKTFTMNLKASKTGKYVNTATATSADGLKAQASTTTVVKQPVLAITKSAPQKRYLGRSVTFDISVSNKGNADAQNTVVEDALPAGTKFMSATGGGQLTGGKVVWNLGTLKPGASRKVSLTVMPSGAGNVKNVAKATAVCAQGVSASAMTNISGIPAVLLEVIDIDDPVELGNNTTYVITATNQGTMAGTNIKMVCTLEDNEKYVSSSGATRGTLQGNKVVFAPLPSLAPKAKATWRVVVKAVKAGDVRFKVTMNADQITRPVEETEATNLYE